MRKKPPQEVLPVQFGPKNEGDHYFILDGKQNIDQLNETAKACGAVYRTEAYYGDFYGIEPGINVREPFSRKNYDQFRPNEALPTSPKGTMFQCNKAYIQVGIIRNIIDLMSDFASQGITISHPVRKWERWLNAWYEKVNGDMVSERYINNLLRFGNVFVKRFLAHLSKSDQKEMMSTQAAETIKMGRIPFFGKGTVPIRYLFLNPLNMEPVSPELSRFVGKSLWAENVGLVGKHYTAPRTDYERELIKEIPSDVQKLLKTPNALLPIDPEKLIVDHYKKDDWSVWGDPLIHSILDDVILYQKAKLADMATLDGVKSAIRLFKLGNSEKGIYPKPAALNMLQAVLSANTGGGPADLFWTDDIEIECISTQDHQFLGSNKYDPILTAIYDGLGIPTTLTSKGGGSNGFTNNALSLKTLVERLKYCRNVLEAFWERELYIVQKAMGISKPAIIDFDFMDLTDDSARGTLLMNLADRGFLSWETVMESIGQNPIVEQRRLVRENKDRSKGKLPPKGGPWNDPQKEYGLKKIALQNGVATPGQVGLKLDPPGPGEMTMHEQNIELAKTKEAAKPKPLSGQPNKGRPKTSKDKAKRKTRTPKVKKAVAEIIEGPFLEHFGVSNIYELSEDAEVNLNILIEGVTSYLEINKLEPTQDNVNGAIECLS